MDSYISEVQRASLNFQKLVAQAHQQLEKEKNELDRQKREFYQMTKKLEDFHVSNKIVLDIGGTRYATSLENLQRVKDSFFSAMFSGIWKLKPESDGSYFIDRDGTNFRYILNYIRNGELTIPEDTNFVTELLEEAEFYQIEPLIEELKNLLPQPFHSVLLTQEHLSVFQTWLGGQYQWRLLYRASRDGFAAQNFHAKCDDKGKTVTIVQDTHNNIFGGYTAQNWNSDSEGVWQTDLTAFLFTFKNPYGIPPMKFSCSLPEYAIYCISSCGPTFGGGPDLVICDNSNMNTSSVPNFPHSYDNTGKFSGKLFTQLLFKTVEIEVFKIV